MTQQSMSPRRALAQSLHHNPKGNQLQLLAGGNQLQLLDEAKERRYGGPCRGLPVPYINPLHVSDAFIF